MSIIGQRLRHTRTFRGLTCEALDQAAGVPAGTTERIEGLARGSKKDAGHVEKIAVALGVRAVWIQRGGHEEARGITAENCIERVPHWVGTIGDRQGICLAGPEMSVETTVGVLHHGEEFARLVGSGAPTKANPARTTAWLVPDPNNAHDPLAVRVVIAELHMGHLARDRASPWQPILLALSRRHGLPVAVPAEVYRDGDKDRVDLFVPVLLPTVVELRLW